MWIQATRSVAIQTHRLALGGELHNLRQAVCGTPRRLTGPLKFRMNAYHAEASVARHGIAQRAPTVDRLRFAVGNFV